MGMTGRLPPGARHGNISAATTVAQTLVDRARNTCRPSAFASRTHSPSGREDRQAPPAVALVSGRQQPAFKCRESMSADNEWRDQVVAQIPALRAFAWSVSRNGPDADDL